MANEREVGRFRQWLSEKLNPAQPSIAAQEVYASPENIVEYETAYRDIEIIHRAVDIVVNACSTVPLVVEGSNPAKRVNKILNIKPNPFEDRVRFFRRAFLDFMLDGNAFFYYDKESYNLYLLPANDVEVIPDERTFVSHYNYLISNLSTQNPFSTMGQQTRKGEAIRFEADEVIHVCADNEESMFRGVSRLKNVERLIELYYYMINFQRQFFKNNAVPGFVLTTDSILSKRVKERVLESWSNSYTTIADNARRPAILDGGLKIDAFSQVKFSELDFENSIERIQQDMSKALGVPYVLLKSGNNANIDANQKLFYMHTIIPMLEQFCSAFMHYFEGVTVKPDKLAVPALRPDEKTQSIYYSSLVNTGIISPNEAREGLGFKKASSAEDSIRVPQNITGSATDATQGGRPRNDESTNPDKDEGSTNG